MTRSSILHALKLWLRTQGHTDATLSPMPIRRLGRVAVRGYTSACIDGGPMRTAWIYLDEVTSEDILRYPRLVAVGPAQAIDNSVDDLPRHLGLMHALRVLEEDHRRGTSWPTRIRWRRSPVVLDLDRSPTPLPFEVRP